MENNYEKDYKKLISYFKYLVTITAIFITAITSITFIFVFPNRTEINEEIEDIKTNAQSSIELTKARAELEISKIRQEAQTLAIDEAKSQIKEAFLNNNIEELIDKVLSEEIEDKLYSEIQQKSDEVYTNLNNDLELMQKFYNSVISMRVGSTREGYYELKHISENHKDAEYRQKASEALNKIIDDYELTVRDLIETRDKNDLIGYLLSIGLFNKKYISNRKENIDDVIDFILNTQNLFLTTPCFMYLREVCGIDIKTFDFEKVKSIKENRASQNKTR